MGAEGDKKYKFTVDFLKHQRLIEFYISMYLLPSIF